MKKNAVLFAQGLSLFLVLTISLVGCSDPVSSLTSKFANAVLIGSGVASEDGSDSAGQESPDSTVATDNGASMENVDMNKIVTVSFDPYDGYFYTSTGKTQNPDRVEIIPGLVSEPPAPWKEGCNFKGWYTYYDWKKKWDFNTVVKDDMTLYALFEESDNPDKKPEIVYDSQNNLYDMGLKPTPIAECDEGKETKTLWVKGVNEKEGWKDHRQYTNNCWGTTTSQMLDWFFSQEKFKGVLASNANAPKTIDETRKWFLELHGEWGWFIRPALQAYFGKWFGDRGLEQYICDYGIGKPLSLDTFSAILYKHLSNGDMGGVVGYMFAGQPHAMSLWGAEFDRNGQVVALWLTTSECTEDEDTLKPRLNKYVRKDTNKAGHYQWDTTFEYYSSAGGFTASQQSYVMDVYKLTFLNGSGIQY